MRIVLSATIESGSRLTIGRSKAPQKSQQFYTDLAVLWTLAMYKCMPPLLQAFMRHCCYILLTVYLFLFKFKTVILMILEDVMG